MKVIRLFILAFTFLLNGGLNIHTFYASTTTIKPNQNGRIVIKLRIFSDDLANALKQVPSVAIANESDLIKQYIKAHLRLRINGKEEAWQWEPVEESGERTQAI